MRGPEALAAFQEQHAALTAKLEGMEAETAEFVRTRVTLLAPLDINLTEVSCRFSVFFVSEKSSAAWCCSAFKALQQPSAWWPRVYM